MREDEEGEGGEGGPPKGELDRSAVRAAQYTIATALGPIRRCGVALCLTAVLSAVLLAPSVNSLPASPPPRIGCARRVVDLWSKLTEPTQSPMQSKRERPGDEEGGDARRQRTGSLPGDAVQDDSDDRETDAEDEEDSGEEESGEDEELTLDEFGRVPGGILPHSACYPDLNYDYRCFPRFLDPAAADFGKLVADCRTSFTARTTRKGQTYSAGETYWLAADATPRCALEQLAQDVFALHTKDKVAGVDFNARTSGAEWWTLVLDDGDDVGLHWDRDYNLETSNGILVHPHLSTVTYLTNMGGPTVVLGCVSPMDADNLPEIMGPINEAMVSRPMPGKHISFDGRLLHGAPADADIWSAGSGGSGGAKGSRVTFLVNVWLNHVPSSAEPFPTEKMAGLASPHAAARAAGAVPLEIIDEQPTAVQVGDVAGTETRKVIDMKFSAHMPLMLRMPLPVASLRGEVKATAEGGSWLLKYAVREDADGPASECRIEAGN